MVQISNRVQIITIQGTVLFVQQIVFSIVKENFELLKISENLKQNWKIRESK